MLWESTHSHGKCLSQPPLCLGNSFGKILGNHSPEQKTWETVSTTSLGIIPQNKKLGKQFRQTTWETVSAKSLGIIPQNKTWETVSVKSLGICFGETLGNTHKGELVHPRPPNSQTNYI